MGKYILASILGGIYWYGVITEIGFNPREVGYIWFFIIYVISITATVGLILHALGVRTDGRGADNTNNKQTLK